MSLNPGARLGAYEVVGLLGAGGMGEVYRAIDSTLRRSVAVKILPQAFATDPERLTRLQREAEVLASLNHPNIATIYGMERFGGTSALVMELVDGPTLADRIASASLPLDEALPIAKQIAEGLEAAHCHGIVHRDLKPANVKVRPDGTVKILDFGLAKAFATDSGGASSPPSSNSPTMTSPVGLTAVGLLVGTAAYMSPEQARGKAVDRRTDMWAFGCILYEMLTGERPFASGSSTADTISAMLTTEPDWSRLPSGTPTGIRTLMQRTLRKDPHARLGDAAAARIEICDAISAEVGPSTAQIGHGAASAVPRSGLWIVAIGLAFALGLWTAGRSQPHAPPEIQVQVALSDDPALLTATLPTSGVLALSPDGRAVAFIAQDGPAAPSQLFVRRLEELRAVPLLGTFGAHGPFFSPDGEWIGFFADGKLKKIPASGGAAIVLADAPIGRGGSWSDDGTIVFTPNGGPHVSLMSVSALGQAVGTVSTLTEDEVTHRWPQFLPGGTDIIFTGHKATNSFDNATIGLLNLKTGERKIVHRGGYHGRYLPSGHLTFIHAGSLYAAPFDLRRRQLSGDPVRLIEGVNSSPATAAAQFDVSTDGTVIYIPRSPFDNDVPISWLSSSTPATLLREARTNWSNPMFAPDGRRVAVDIFDGAQVDIWTYNWQSDTATQLTFDSSDDQTPLWRPDGQHIAFSSRRSDKTTFNLYLQSADGSSEAKRLTTSKNPQYPGSWHPTGKLITFQENNPQTGWDLMVLALEPANGFGWPVGVPTPLLNTPTYETQPRISPDGRWLAYVSEESGRREVYVQSFPGPGGRWKISTEGGADPTWSPNSSVIYLSGPNNQIMAVPYTASDGSFRVGKPQQWSETRFQSRPRQWRAFDVHPDGLRIAAAATSQMTPGLTPANMVYRLNMFAALHPSGTTP